VEKDLYPMLSAEIARGSGSAQVLAEYARHHGHRGSIHQGHQKECSRPDWGVRYLRHGRRHYPTLLHAEEVEQEEFGPARATFLICVHLALMEGGRAGRRGLTRIFVTGHRTRLTCATLLAGGSPRPGARIPCPHATSHLRRPFLGLSFHDPSRSPRLRDRLLHWGTLRRLELVGSSKTSCPHAPRPALAFTARTLALH
jgi:hypothetical protein